MGGFGYFDTSDRQYHLYVPPEVADYSVSAIRVEPDVVWMSILSSGEYGDSPAGVLRYDRKTHAVRKYELAGRRERIHRIWEPHTGVHEVGNRR